MSVKSVKRLFLPIVAQLSTNRLIQVKSRKNVISVKMISLKMVVLLTIRVFIQVKSRKNVISVKIISLKKVALLTIRVFIQVKSHFKMKVLVLLPGHCSNLLYAIQIQVQMQYIKIFLSIINYKVSQKQCMIIIFKIKKPLQRRFYFFFGGKYRYGELKCVSNLLSTNKELI